MVKWNMRNSVGFKTGCAAAGEAFADDGRQNEKSPALFRAKRAPRYHLI